MRRKRVRGKDLYRNCFVYVVATVINDELCAPVKVGISDDPDARFAQLATACPNEIRMVFAYRMPDRDKAVQVERFFHECHADCRKSGEWFDMEPDHALESLETTLQHDWYFGNNKINCPYLVEWLWKLTGSPRRDDEED